MDIPLSATNFQSVLTNKALSLLQQLVNGNIWSILSFGFLQGESHTFSSLPGCRDNKDWKTQCQKMKNKLIHYFEVGMANIFSSATSVPELFLSTACSSIWVLIERFSCTIASSASYRPNVLFKVWVVNEFLFWRKYSWIILRTKHCLEPASNQYQLQLLSNFNVSLLILKCLIQFHTFCKVRGVSNLSAYHLSASH